MKKFVASAFCILSLSSAFAGGAFDGIYRLGATSTYWTVQQNGDHLIAAEFSSMPSTGVISGSTATLSGNTAFGSCLQTTSAVFDGFGNVRATITALANTAQGTKQGIDCQAVLAQIQSTSGLTLTLTKVAF